MHRAIPFVLLASICAASSSPFRSNTWTMHDPGFPVQIDVAPSQDELWTAADAHQDVLHVSSTVLDVSVAFPEGISTDGALVTMSFFEPSSSSTTETFDMFVDSQLQYVRQYRVELDRAKAGNRFIMRVYVEASASKRNGTEGENGAKLRAFYARWVDLSPSEPRHVACESVEGREDNEDDVRVSAHPPANMPMDLCKSYTMDGRIPLRKWYFDDQTGADRAYGEEFSQEYINNLVEEARKHVVGYSTVDIFLFAGLEKYPLAGKRVLIVGSSGIPWAESICLAQNAKLCTTVSRNRLRYEHPGLQTFTTAEFKDAGTSDFDVVIAIASLASEGLGRAGDPLDPDGDLKVMDELRNFSSPICATVFIGVPVGPDTLVWNAQRQYGPLRLPLLLKEWQVIDSYGFAQSDFTNAFNVSHTPLFVLKPSASCVGQANANSARGEHTEL